MLFKFFFSLNSLLLQTSVTDEEVARWKTQSDQLELSRLTTILSIALVAFLSIILVSFYTNYKLRQENKRLKSQISG